MGCIKSATDPLQARGLNYALLIVVAQRSPVVSAAMLMGISQIVLVRKG
ncbi:hypothetical protein [Cesiribacter andamanensis]|nr:hypothetical protein [Cesiribacter andamanensis]